MRHTLYTIGYAGFDIEDLAALLRERGADLVVDVRSLPFSSQFPDYNKEVAAAVLQRRHIDYASYSHEFGARSEDGSCYNAAGFVDFALLAKTEAFRLGLEKLNSSMEQGRTPALLCAEKDPLNCHRAILVARAFHQQGHEVIHLLPKGQTQTQDELELRLLDLYFPGRAQLSLFDERSDAQLLDEAYAQQNAKIGFHQDKEER